MQPVKLFEAFRLYFIIVQKIQKQDGKYSEK